MITLPLHTSLCFLSIKNSLPPLRLISATKMLSSLSTSPSAMDSSSASVLVLCGKSAAENEIAISLKLNNSLKLPDNSEVSVLLHSEIDKLFAEESFRINLFMDSLSTNRFGRFLIWSPRLPSTHDVISQNCVFCIRIVLRIPYSYSCNIGCDSNFSDLPIGVTCIADVQFKGRGRTTNVWESPMGCLLFSFTIQTSDGHVLPLLQYVVSLAMTEAIKDVCNRNGLPYLDVKIKWPNDIYLNGQKVGGILCTSTYQLKKFNVSAGIGLNVDNNKPTTCLNAILREISAVECDLRREDILAAFFNKFENLFDLFMNQGFQALEELYYKTWLHSGQRVTVLDKSENQEVETVVTILGLTSSGYLLAVTEDNQICQLHPDGNSLDFFQGLVKRKLD